MGETANAPATTESWKTGRRVQRLGSAVRVVVVVALVAALVAWGVFAVTTIQPNPSDSTSIFGVFQATSYSPSWPVERYDLQPGSTVNFVFDIHFSPYGICSSGASPSIARNGTFAVLCWMRRPNSTLTTDWKNYVNFNIAPETNCCQQTYYSWVSGPQGSLTANQGGGGFFEASQEGNYTAHISNTVNPGPQGVPLGNVNGTLTFTLGHVLFQRPYFTAGLATIGVAAVFTSYTLLSLLFQRQKKDSSKQMEPGRRRRERLVPPGQLD